MLKASEKTTADSLVLTVVEHRNHVDPVKGWGGIEKKSSYYTGGTVQAGTEILADKGKFVCNMLCEIADFGDFANAEPGRVIPDSYNLPEIRQIVNDLNAEEHTGDHSSCRSACTGLCVATCDTTCNGCTGTCEGGCQTGCNTTCGTGCTSSCGSGCSGGCSSNCSGTSVLKTR